MALKLNKINQLFTQSKNDNTGIAEKSNKESGIYAIPAIEFVVAEGAAFYQTDNNSGESGLSTTANNTVILAGIHLPQGSTVTKAIGRMTVASTGTWKLYRVKIKNTEVGDDPVFYMANGDVNVEDTSIENAVIDNENYKYVFEMKMTNSLHSFIEAVINYNF